VRYDAFLKSLGFRGLSRRMGAGPWNRDLASLLG